MLKYGLVVELHILSEPTFKRHRREEASSSATSSPGALGDLQMRFPAKPWSMTNGKTLGQARVDADSTQTSARPDVTFRKHQKSGRTIHGSPRASLCWR